MSFLSNLSWRYATKKYDGTKAVSREDLDKILTAIQMAPTALGLQPFHIVVTEGDMKNKLIESSGQVDKLGATYLLVFCARNDLAEHAERYMKHIMSVRDVTREDIAGFQTMVEGHNAKHSPQSALGWAARQTYLALGFALAAATELQVDSSPMEGFSPEKFHEILGLPAHIQPVAIMALGYRNSEDPFDPSRMKKVRAPKEELFEERK